MKELFNYTQVRAQTHIHTKNERKEKKQNGMENNFVSQLEPIHSIKYFLLFSVYPFQMSSKCFVLLHKTEKEF